MVCRQVEVSIFPRAEVRAHKSKFVEVRLHADTEDEVLRERIAGLIATVAKSPAQPIYVTFDPDNETELYRWGGGITQGEVKDFAEFLRVSSEELEGSH